MAKTKIEILELQKTVEDLIAAGTTTSTGISLALRQAGHAISQPSISRYLKMVRETRTEETQKIVQDHIHDVVPADLNALENMEAKCLSWAHEEKDAFAHRLAEQHIAARLDEWRDILISTNRAAYSDDDEYEDARREAVRKIRVQCLGWIADDLNLQKSRIFAMRQATSIIDLKLRYSGIIGADQEGNIIMVRPDQIKEDAQTGRLMVLKGGKDG